MIIYKRHSQNLFIFKIALNSNKCTLNHVSGNVYFFSLKPFHFKKYFSQRHFPLHFYSSILPSHLLLILQFTSQAHHSLVENWTSSDDLSLLSTATQNIRFNASLALAETGSILVRCLANIPDLYYRIAEQWIQVDVPEELRRVPEYSLFGEFMQFKVALIVATC